MIEALNELHEEFFRLFGRLYFNSEFLSKEQYDSMAKKLSMQYEVEYKLLLRRCLLEREKEKYEIRHKEKEFMPVALRFLFWKRKSRMAELIENEVQADAEVFFKLREEKLKAFMLENGIDEEERKETLETEISE